jgi:hypothetical protein
MIESLLLLILVVIAPSRLWKMLIMATGGLMTFGGMSDHPADRVIVLALAGAVATAIYTARGKDQAKAKR